MRYKLIKEYPGSPPLNYIAEIQKGTNMYFYNRLEIVEIDKFSEFWQPETEWVNNYWYIRCCINGLLNEEPSCYNGYIEKKESCKSIDYILKKYPIFFVEYLHGCAMYIREDYVNKLPEFIQNKEIKFSTRSWKQRNELESWFAKQYKIKPTYTGKFVVNSYFEQWLETDPLSQIRYQ